MSARSLLVLAVTMAIGAFGIKQATISADVVDDVAKKIDAIIAQEAAFIAKPMSQQAASGACSAPPSTSASTSTSSSDPASKLWDGGYADKIDAEFEAFSSSIAEDMLLYRMDIAGSMAHATMLATIGRLTAPEHDLIINGLEQIAADIASGDLRFGAADEDIHMAIEGTLTKRIGDAGKKLHTGRSRNDQVATDFRLFVRVVIDVVVDLIRQLQSAIVSLAGRHSSAIMPAMTHMQNAQPITFGHHLMSWASMLERDLVQLQAARDLTNRCPLGSGALAGTTFELDRDLTSRLLSFAGPMQNSLDAVSDRDFCQSFAFASQMLMNHLSRISADIVMWFSTPFQYVTLPASLTSGSSMMPQKRNPDISEIIRGKAAVVLGHGTGLQAQMMGQIMGYNRDNNEGKKPVFAIAFELLGSLKMQIRVTKGLQPRLGRMEALAAQGFTTATDLAEYLVKHDVVPFRDAHSMVAKIVNAAGAGMTLAELPDDQFPAEIPRHHLPDLKAALSLSASVQARDLIGGTSPAQVQQQVAIAEDRLSRARSL